MKKQFTLLVMVATLLFIGCSKDEKTRMYNDELVGKKFRAKAYISEAGGGQIYDVFEFKNQNTVISGYRFANDAPVNANYLVSLEWRKDGTTGTGIVVKYRSFTSDESEVKEIKGIVTDGILSFPDKVGEAVYEEY